MVHKITNIENHLLVLGKNYKSDSFPYIVAEKLTTGDYQLWQVDNPNDWDEPNQFEILAHLPLGQAAILEGVPLLPSLRDDSRCDVDEATERFRKSYSKHDISPFEVSAFAIGYLQAREKYKYTELDVIHLLHKTARKYFQEGREYKGNMAIAGDPLHGVRHELINMLQSLHQYPTEFETEDVLTPSQIFYPNDVPYSSPKTITTAQGVQWVGKYL